jgi:hypothetical protein
VLDPKIANAEIWETLQQQRRALRRPVGQVGTVLTEPGATPHYCIVMDESDAGVRISIPHDLQVPSKFILRRYPGEEASYEVVWRKGRLIGARCTSKASLT